jgi:hypothetical protein
MMSLLRIGYSLIFETSSAVSVFQVPGNPQVISNVLGFRFASINLVKGSFKDIPLTVSFG